MNHCINCELYPVATIDNEPLCRDHVEQWNTILTRHAPLDNPFIRLIDRMSPQQGVTSHTPRHYK